MEKKKRNHAKKKYNDYDDTPIIKGPKEEQKQRSISSKTRKRNDRAARFQEEIKTETNFLEKSYTRTTGGSNTNTKRSKSQLGKAFDFVKSKYENPELPKCGFEYLNDQIRQIRQELTSQNAAPQIRIEVYEYHARECAKNGNIDHFIQCANQLSQLYAKNQKLRSNQIAFQVLMVFYLNMSDLQCGLTTFLQKIDKQEVLVFHKELSKLLITGKRSQILKKLGQNQIIENVINQQNLHEELEGLSEKYLPQVYKKQLHNFLRTYAIGIKEESLQKLLNFKGDWSKFKKENHIVVNENCVINSRETIMAQIKNK